MPRTRVDYATDQITVYRYCPYRCRYCYVWNNKLFISRITRGRYNPVEEARKYRRSRDRIIVVSFVSDPYPPEEEYKKITRRVLEELGKSRNTVMVLTKNPILALRDIDIMCKSRAEFYLGTTVITLDTNESLKLEPLAPYPLARLYALEQAKKKCSKVKTWISIEPIIPNVTIPEEIVKTTIEYVDYYVFGALNYARRLGLPYTDHQLRKYYNEHIPKTIRIVKEYGKEYHIKKELKKYLNQI